MTTIRLTPVGYARRGIKGVMTSLSRARVATRDEVLSMRILRLMQAIARAERECFPARKHKRRKAA